MTGAYYTRNERFLDSKVNRTFGEICFLSDRDFDKWVRELRSALRKDWIYNGQPPKPGITEEEIVTRLQAVSDLDVSSFLRIDEKTFRKNCLVNNHKGLNAADAFFPNMGRMRETKSLGKPGLSQFDLIVDPRNLKLLATSLHRLFKRDGRFLFSIRVQKRDQTKSLVSAGSGKAWIRSFAKVRAAHKNRDFFLEAKTSKKRHGASQPATLSARDAQDLLKDGSLKRRHLVHVKLGECVDSDRFFIRLLRKDTRIFPKGFVAFQSGLVHSGTNFPAATAKYLYQRYTKDLRKQKRIVIYDPSAGYGGRLVGALAAAQDRPIHYVGTDPNPDHWLPNLKATRYDYLASFYNEYVTQGGKGTWDTYGLGSEMIHQDQSFQEYKGKVDLVFSSPPYFSAEGYADDDSQSSVKFPEYDQWRDGFLAKTLETAVRWLKRDRYLLWNVADTKIGKYLYPIEDDSIEILKSLGMKWVDTIQMVLAKSRGANRIGRYRRPTTKNYCAIGGAVYKYEPIFVFKKTSS